MPFLGRLSLADYRRILLTFLILAGETVLRAFVYLLPVSLLDWLRYHMITYKHCHVFSLITVVIVMFTREFFGDGMMRILGRGRTLLSAPPVQQISSELSTFTQARIIC